MSTNTAPTKDIRINGIILRRTNYGEADRILNFLTEKSQIKTGRRHRNVFTNRF